MATPVSEVVKVNWKQVLPWVALFRTFGLALHVRQIAVGVVAAALIALGHWFVIGDTLQRRLDGDLPDPHLLSWVWAPMVDVTWPLAETDGLKNLRGGGPELLSWWALSKTVVVLVWGGLIGGFAGGILVRRAAFEFCREESLSLNSAVRFVWQRAFDYISAPGLPLAAVTVLGLLLAFAGWLGSALPGGTYLLSVTWTLGLAVGLVMAALLLAVFLAWPLMIAAISINGGDGFDALSRGFGFVLDRWRYYTWCAWIMTAYGGLIYLLLWGFLWLGNYLLITAIALGLGSNPMSTLPPTLPRGGWALALQLLLTGFAYSFFWSNMTITYLVLRKSVDNANLEDIYLEGAAQSSEALQSLLNPQMAPAAPTLLPIIDPPR